MVAWVDMQEYQIQWEQKCALSMFFMIPTTIHPLHISRRQEDADINKSLV